MMKLIWILQLAHLASRFVLILKCHLLLTRMDSKHLNAFVSSKCTRCVLHHDEYLYKLLSQGDVRKLNIHINIYNDWVKNQLVLLLLVNFFQACTTSASQKTNKVCWQKIVSSMSVAMRPKWIHSKGRELLWLWFEAMVSLKLRSWWDVIWSLLLAGRLVVWLWTGRFIQQEFEMLGLGGRRQKKMAGTEPTFKQ